MKPWKILAIVAALVGMTGCAVYAPGPAPAGYYEPAYVGPSVGVSVYSGGGYHHHHRY